MAKKAAAKKVAAKKVARTRVTDDDLIGDAPKKPATKQAKVKVSDDETLTASEVGVDPNARIVRGVVIPPYPPELATIQDGDKTPAVKKWFKDNHPEAYDALYQNTVG
jgi:hypothetical protein